MALKYPPRLRKAIERRRPSRSKVDGKVGWNIHQFGQAGDYYTFGGGTGCTHTFVQWVVFLWKGIKITHDKVSQVAGYPLPGRNGAMRGLYPSEVQRVLDHYGIPMKLAFGLTAVEVREASELGPVGFGHRYDSWPDWKGYRVRGSATDGRPNGYAQPSGEAGKTQSTWDGAHFGWLLGIAIDPSGPDKVYACEPNHGSAARSERPPYDIMTVPQFDEVYDSYKDRLGRTPYAVICTKPLPATGW